MVETPVPEACAVASGTVANLANERVQEVGEVAVEDWREDSWFSSESDRATRLSGLRIDSL